MNIKMDLHNIFRLGCLCALAFLYLIFAVPAFAQTACLTTEDGEQRYNAGDLQFCNSSTWLNMGNTASTGACASAGLQQYTTGATGMEYCDGSDLHNMACYTSAVCSDEGQERYNNHDMQYCDGTNWISINQYLCAGLTPCGGFTTGDDTVTCTAADEFIDALAGVDIVNAGAGNDVVFGSDGDDTIEGGDGTDSLYGGAGDDTFKFFSENYPSDTAIYGGAGTDILLCQTGTTWDVITLPATFSLAGNSIEAITCQYPSEAHDRIEDTSNIDNIWDFTGITITGVDSINGEGGNDIITGTSVADIIDGGDGADSLYGGDGDDIFRFYNENYPADTIINGGSGTDTLLCRAGAIWDVVTIPATFSLAGNSIEAITCQGPGEAYDRIQDMDDVANTWDFTDITITGVNSINGEDGDDSIIGSSGDDTINGGNDNDTLEGGAGADSLYGGNDNDTLIYTDATHVGTDTVIDGGSGTDNVFFNFTGGITNTLDGWLLGNDFEELEMTNADATDSVSITVSSITSPSSLYIRGDAGDNVTSLDTPTHVSGGDVNVSGVDYGAFTSGSGTLYVEFGLVMDAVTVVANP